MSNLIAAAKARDVRIDDLSVEHRPLQRAASGILALNRLLKGLKRQMYDESN